MKEKHIQRGVTKIVNQKNETTLVTSTTIEKKTINNPENRKPFEFIRKLLAKWITYYYPL